MVTHSPHLKRARLSEQVAAAIRNAVLSRQLKPGEQVVQTEWAQRLGVSRMPVRDAISTLCAEGILVISHTNSSTAVVVESSVEDLKDSYAINSFVLGLMTRRATPRLTDDEIERLEQLNDRMADVARQGDLASMPELNREFHRGINRAANSPRLAAFLRLAENSIPHSTFEYPNWPDRSLQDHRDILAALRARDVDRAEVLMRQHVEAGSRVILREIGMLDDLVPAGADLDPALPPGQL